VSRALEGGAPPRMAASLFVVADELGFVGAFSSEAKAKALAFDRFPTADLMFLEFQAAAGPAETVWVVYLTNNAIVHVSNSEAHARAVHQVFVRFGYAYDDDLCCWQHPIDQVQALAAERLETRGRRRAAQSAETKAAQPAGGPEGEAGSATLASPAGLLELPPRAPSGATDSPGAARPAALGMGLLSATEAGGSEGAPAALTSPAELPPPVPSGATDSPGAEHLPGALGMGILSAAGGRESEGAPVSPPE
jgi:hypothetical protein